MSEYEGLQILWTLLIILVFVAYLLFFIKQVFTTAVIDFKLKVAKANYEEKLEKLRSKLKQTSCTHKLITKLYNLVIKYKPLFVTPGNKQVQEMFERTKDKIDFTDKNYHKEDEFLSYKRKKFSSQTQILFATEGKISRKKFDMFGRPKIKESEDEENEENEELEKVDDDPNVKSGKKKKKNKKAKKLKKLKKPPKIKKVSKVAQLLDSNSGSSDEEPNRIVNAGGLNKINVPQQDLSRISYLIHNSMSPKILLGEGSPESLLGDGSPNILLSDNTPVNQPAVKKSIFSFNMNAKETIPITEEKDSDDQQVKHIELFSIHKEDQNQDQKEGLL